MPNRREFLQKAAQVGLALALPRDGASTAAEASPGIIVNDLQSQLNATRVRRIVQPASLDALQGALRDARRDSLEISIAGGRHAMGGQQFGRDTVLIDMKKLNNIVGFDATRGHIEVQGGIEWPELIDYLHRNQGGAVRPWAIREKQTGVDRVSLGGSLAANIHGRGLRFPPIISDVESILLLDAHGKLHHCSRSENTELFSLAIGGYGLFGIIAQVTLRLAPRSKVERVVEVIPVKDLSGWVDKRLEQQFIFGDCQYSTDLETDAGSHMGVFSCYRAVDPDTVVTENQKQLTGKEWAELYRLARTDKKKAFQKYSEYYLSTSGQIYWSDTHQLAGNFEQYNEGVDPAGGTEMITEIYVTRDSFLPFLSTVRRDFLEHNVDMTYGTIRFIEQDSESFLPWARESAICIVCNLHVLHTDAGIRKATQDFRRIIDRAIEHGGSYYLTYHRWATRRQVETCYPRFVDFLRLKKKYDPEERFQSDWYRHYRDLFSDSLSQAQL